MEILRTIKFYCEAKDLRFIMIGGHAVNSYGLSRQTGDIDLLARSEDSFEWDKLLKKLRYIEFQRTKVFARFRPGELAAWPIDLMFVDSNTFEKMYAEAFEFDFGIVTVKIASLRHLIALKIHALKTPQKHRELKDYGDILELLRRNKNALTHNELKALCEKYASLELFYRLEKDLGGIK